MITTYIENINRRFKTGISTEHTFRGDLQTLVEKAGDNVLATNEPERIKCGAPDFIITKKGIPIGYIEAKDIGISLEKMEKTDQIKRYRESLGNLIVTDYLDFRLYRSGEFRLSVSLAKMQDKQIVPITKNYRDFENLLYDFLAYIGQTIASPEKLSEMMAGKARMLQGILEKALVSDEESEQNSTLKDHMNAFRKILIHDIHPSDFADIYAQTLTYGMFAARLHDTDLEDFSRQKAAELIPKSNPFLRHLFTYIAGPNIDERIRWVVDDLADIFRACDIHSIRNKFDESEDRNDPVIHFYETFLSKYSPKLRKSRGVWYTPEPVVKFIVRAVDDILQNEFDLPMGLADTSKTSVILSDHKSQKKEIHKVQILDPAAGTGTFLVEVIKKIHKKFKGQEGMWSRYVETDLIPRLSGFEILMASYAIAHLKMELVLEKTGYKSKNPDRLRIFLTNSLEEVNSYTGTLFERWLSREGEEANFIKQDMPIMVVIGNPPYANFGQMNQGKWIRGLVADYKKGLGEKKINLDDDYIKFIRYAHHHIEKNGQGIVAMITNNSFLDGITHRQMRKSLLETFDKIYIIDLHGNAKKKEVCPDGSADRNVFDIMQGVSINIFVKTGKKQNGFTEVFHYDLQGKRECKYETLNKNSLKTFGWNKPAYKEPYFFFVPKDFVSNDEYKNGFKTDALFQKYVSGFQTKRDKISIHFSEEELMKIKDIFLHFSVSEIRSILSLPEDGRDWTIEWAKNDLNRNKHRIVKILYRPFDERFTFCTGKSKGFIAYPRGEMFTHLNNKDNFSILMCRQQSSSDFRHIFITRLVSDMCNISSQTKETGYIFPLYLYPETNGQQNIAGRQKRTPNLNMELVAKIAEKIRLHFTPEKEDSKSAFAPIDILDYIYAVLHSPSYRETYREFLKIDFPRVPYPGDAKTFWKLVKFGEKFRTIHLLENPKAEQYITTYPQDGDNVITRKIAKKDFEITDKKFKTGRVWINEIQYFDNVPETAWEFYIGGYQPAQKWLRDRQGRELKISDILHYQKMIAALMETDNIMKKIDKIWKPE